jgi:hypothetical protein
MRLPSLLQKTLAENSKIILPLPQTLGVPLPAEIIPSKPDADNAAVGKKKFLSMRHS